MRMPVIVRLAEESDLEAVLNLYLHLHSPGDRPTPAAAKAAWCKIMSTEATLVVLAEIDTVSVASCCLAIIPNLTRGARPYAVIENVVTHSDYRRQGYGRQVLAYAVDLAREQSCYKVVLATGSKRASTLEFYEKAGFKQGLKTHFELHP